MARLDCHHAGDNIPGTVDNSHHCQSEEATELDASHVKPASMTEWMVTLKKDLQLYSPESNVK